MDLDTSSYSGQWWILIPTPTQVSGGSGYQLLLRSVVDPSTSSCSGQWWTRTSAPTQVSGGPVYQLLLRFFVTLYQLLLMSVADPCTSSCSDSLCTHLSAPTQVRGGPVHQLLLRSGVDPSTSSCSDSLWTCLPAPAQVSGGPVQQLLLGSGADPYISSCSDPLWNVDLSTSSCSCQWRTRTPYSCHMVPSFEKEFRPPIGIVIWLSAKQICLTYDAKMIMVLKKYCFLHTCIVCEIVCPDIDCSTQPQH